MCIRDSLVAVRKCDFYLRGLPSFEVITDHRPLLGVFKNDIFKLDNARLMRIREKLIPYNFTISWIEGKKNVVADALSRYPVFPAEEEEDIHTVSPVSFQVTLSEGDKEVLFTIDTMATNANQEYINLRDAVLNSDENIPDSPVVQSYKRVWDRLSVSSENNNLVLLDLSLIHI